MGEQDPNSELPEGRPSRNSDADRKRIAALILIPIIFFAILQLFFFPQGEVKRVSYSEFYQMLLRNAQSQEIVSAELTEDMLIGKLRTGGRFQVVLPDRDLEIIPLIRQNIQDFNVSPPQVFWKNLIYSVMPVVLLIAFFWFFVYRGVAQGGGKIFSFGKSRAKLSDKNKITFQDVAGVKEAKEELQEIIEYLKDPKKFQKLGGRIPKGVLLMGPPGTGKTLLAKAVAGEANVPFFSISGSDFVEMFVGVGAARVRDLFEQGKRAAKISGRGSILFIDEIDAVGRQRFAGVGGGHDEREQTLNALLVEMDGFEAFCGVILIGATNRPDVLDPALLRPGRFDRQIVVDRPDISGREEILKVHIRNVKLDPSCDLNKIARQTPGFSGADLANLANEAALLAARRSKEAVTQPELEESIERVMAGPERKSRVISKREKEIVAVHESGHAILTLLLMEGTDNLHKVSIIPRGTSALGYTLNLPLEDRYLVTEAELLQKITVLLGGRTAEEIMFNSVTSGAANDFEVATDYARRMVCEFGMSRRLGTLTFGKNEHQIFLGRDFFEQKNLSQETVVAIDQEIKRIVDESHAKARELLTQNKDKLILLSQKLLEREVMDSDEIRQLLGFAAEVKPQSVLGV